MSFGYSQVPEPDTRGFLSAAADDPDLVSFFDSEFHSITIAYAHLAQQVACFCNEEIAVGEYTVDIKYKGSYRLKKG